MLSHALISKDLGAGATVTNIRRPNYSRWCLMVFVFNARLLEVWQHVERSGWDVCELSGFRDKPPDLLEHQRTLCLHVRRNFILLFPNHKTTPFERLSYDTAHHGFPRGDCACLTWPGSVTPALNLSVWLKPSNPPRCV